MPCLSANKPVGKAIVAPAIPPMLFTSPSWKGVAPSLRMYMDRNWSVSLVRKVLLDDLAMLTLNGFGCFLMNLINFSKTSLFKAVTYTQLTTFWSREPFPLDLAPIKKIMLESKCLDWKPPSRTPFLRARCQFLRARIWRGFKSHPRFMRIEKMQDLIETLRLPLNRHMFFSVIFFDWESNIIRML